MNAKVIWISSADLQPDEGQEVLVNHSDTISLATFADGFFTLADHSRLSVMEPGLRWTALSDTDHPD